MRFINFFAVIIVIAVFVFFAIVVLGRFPSDQPAHDVMMILVGALASTLSTVVGYYFGSSKGSADKTDTINKIANRG